MQAGKPIRVRRSINSIYNEYVEGQKTNNPVLQKQLNDLIRAFKGIYDLSHKDPDNEHSFFKIGGFHGAPFRGAGYANPQWWGGFCHHGNILFPTWHRAYCLRIEKALQSIDKCEDVTLPYWDETGEDTKLNGVPGIFLQPEFKLDGVDIPNPLFSYQLPKTVVDTINQDEKSATYNQYTKPKGYNTVRYPYSGLVGTEAAREATKKHNDQFVTALGSDLLSENVKSWLGTGIVIDKKFVETGTRSKFAKCLEAPNYTVFSNTTSAHAWNDEHPPSEYAISVESPHNDIHLAVGGFDIPGEKVKSPISGANGDMGENDTAGLDPMFFIHHAEIDRYFWLWQRKTGNTEHLNVIPEYPGTNSIDNQGATPGVAGGTWLTLDSPLHPFIKHGDTYMTSNDVINIEKQLGYTYEMPSGLPKAPPKRPEVEGTIRVSNINKNNIAGSHLLAVYAKFPGEEEETLVGTESILSRWDVGGCANCQNSVDVQRHIPLYGTTPDKARVDVIRRTGPGGDLFRDAPLNPRSDIIKRGECYSG